MVNRDRRNLFLFQRKSEHNRGCPALLMQKNYKIECLVPRERVKLLYQDADVHLLNIVQMYAEFDEDAHNG